jgi:hypothetical protein
MELAANAYYSEDALVDGLGVSRRWLRRSVGAIFRNSERFYLGADVLAAMRPTWEKKPSGEVFVYFIQAGENGPIKIGIAADHEDRMRSLQVGHYEELRLLKTILTTGKKEAEKLEAQFHARFHSYHLRGEWFSPSEDLLAFARRI